MSSCVSNKYKIVLYQAGLGSNHSHFNTAMKKISNFGGKHIVYKEEEKDIYNSYIDMSLFNPIKGCFYGLSSNGYVGKSSILAAEFDSKIIKIIDVLKNNPNKILHIKTQLTNSIGFEDGFESIENQKIKLIYIINSIKSYDIDVDISLVGHSQGGLVNIETAIEIPNKIKSIIDISTPFAPVSVAKNLLYLDRFLKLINKDGIITGDNESSTKRYEDRANILTSESYFNNLKNKWSNTSNRPKLLVITGTSGHVTRTVTETVKIGVGLVSTPMVMTFEKKYPFDGLVLTCEQCDILHDSEVNFTNSLIPCYNDNTYLKKSCGANIYDRCLGCCLPNFGIADTVFNLAIDGIFKQINVKDNDIINAIFAGAFNYSDYNKNYQNYYDIYASQYSHMYLAQYDLTISTILGYVE